MDAMHDTELAALARRTRDYLEPLWIGFLCGPWSSVGLPLSTGACRVSSEFLAAILPGHGFHGWQVHGGPDAFTREDGTREDHYWLSDGTDVLDVTADQFGLPQIVLGPLDPARYRPGAAMPLSEAARSEAGCIEAWVAGWGGHDAAKPRGPMTSAAMDAFAGPRAAELALLLHRELGLPLFAASAPGAAPHPVAWDGHSAFDARGRTGHDAFVHMFGVEPAALVPLDPAGIEASLGPGTDDDAYGFAMAHPALREAIVQSFYQRRDAAMAADSDADLDAEEIPCGPGGGGRAAPVDGHGRWTFEEDIPWEADGCGPKP